MCFQHGWPLSADAGKTNGFSGLQNTAASSTTDEAMAIKTAWDETSGHLCDDLANSSKRLTKGRVHLVTPRGDRWRSSAHIGAHGKPCRQGSTD